MKERPDEKIIATIQCTIFMIQCLNLWKTFFLMILIWSWILHEKI